MNKISKEGIILGGLGIFTVGIIIGTQLNYGNLANIEGFLFNKSYAYSTDSNATSSNATSSNATSSNATCSNATSTDATSSNVSSTDNILYLDYFDILTESVSVGDNIKLGLTTSGAKLIGASVVISNNLGNSYTLVVESIDNDSYIVIPKTLVEAKYEVTDVLLIGENINGSTFTKHYSNNKIGDEYYYNFNESFDVKNNNQSNKESILLKNISIKDPNVKVNDKVYLNIDTNMKLSNLKLQFTSKNMTFNVTVNSLNSNPYFIVPSNVKADTYELSMVSLISDNSSKVYSNSRSNSTEYYKFNISLKVEDNTTSNNYTYNNEDVTNEIISKLYSDKNANEIEINADSNSIISSDLFNTIKGTNKKLIFNYDNNQIVFNGQNITNVKSIDVRINVSSLVNDEAINKLVNGGIVVNFANNGDLPGVALIRINSSKVNSLLNDDVYVYYYNEVTNKFTLIAENVSKTADGYYEFSINHNSKYVLVNSKLDNSLIDEVNENIVSFQRGKKTNYTLIVVGVILVIAVAALVIVLSKKGKKNEE